MKIRKEGGSDIGKQRWQRALEMPACPNTPHRPHKTFPPPPPSPPVNLCLHFICIDASIGRLATCRLISRVSPGYRRPLSGSHYLAQATAGAGGGEAMFAEGGLHRAHILTRAHTLIIPLSPPAHPPHQQVASQVGDKQQFATSAFLLRLPAAGSCWLWQPLEGFCLNCDGDEGEAIKGEGMWLHLATSHPLVIACHPPFFASLASLASNSVTVVNFTADISTLYNNNNNNL